MFKLKKLLGATTIAGFILGFAMFFAVAMYLLKQHGDLYSPTSSLHFYLYRLPFLLSLASCLIIILISKNISLREKLFREFTDQSGPHKSTWLVGLIFVLFGSAFISFGWLTAFLFVQIIGN